MYVGTGKKRGRWCGPRLASGPLGDQVPFDVLTIEVTAGTVPIFKLITSFETLEFLSPDRGE